MTRTVTSNLAIILAMLFVTTGIKCRGKSAQTSAGSAERISAADVFTGRYAQSRFSQWNIRANAAGADCDVLFVRTSLILDDSMIEALHYGAGTYDLFEGGVQQFSRDRVFRGVAYKDGSGKVWVYGDVTIPEAERMKACRGPL